MTEFMRTTPVHEAGIFVGGRDLGLKAKNPSLYEAYTRGEEPPATVYIGDDISRLLGNPEVQSQITAKLHSSPELIQIRVTPDAELQVAKRGSSEFHSIDFRGRTPPELRAIVSKTQAVYHQMQTSRAFEEEVPTRPRSWSAGYPASPGHSAPSEHVAHLHERIHSLEHELAIERMRGDMQGMRSEIREIRSLLERLLEAQARGETVSQAAIENLRHQLQAATGQVESLTERARTLGLENTDLREENAALQRDLSALHKELVAETTPKALRNLERLERTLETLKQQQEQLQEVLETEHPDQLIPKALALRTDNADLAEQLQQAKRARQAAEDGARDLKRDLARANQQIEHDRQTAQSLLERISTLETDAAGNADEIRTLKGQLKELHDKLYPSSHEGAVATLEVMIEKLQSLQGLERTLQDILDLEDPSEILAKVIELSEQNRLLLEQVPTLREQLERSEHLRSEAEREVAELRSALEQKSEQLVSLQQEFSTLRESFEEQVHISERARKEQAEIAERLKSTTSDKDALARDLESAREQLRLSEKAQAALREEMAVLEKRATPEATAALRLDLERFQAALRQHQDTLREIQDKDLPEAQEAARKWEDEARRQEERYRGQLETNRLAESQHREHANTLGQQLTEKQARIGTLEEELQEAFRKIEHVDGIAKKEEAHVAELDRELQLQKSEFAALREEHQRALSELRETQAEGQQLQKGLAEARALLDERAALIAELEKRATPEATEALQKRLAEAESTAADRQRQLEEAQSQFRETHATDHETIERLTAGRKEAVDRVRALQQQVDALEEVSREHDNLQREKGHLEKRIEKLKTRATPEATEALQKRLAEAESTAADRQRQLEEAHSQFSKTHAINQETIDSLEQKRHAAVEQVQELREQVDRLEEVESEHKKLQREKGRLEKRIERLETRATPEQTAALQKKLDQAAATIAERDRQLKETLARSEETHRSQQELIDGLEVKRKEAVTEARELRRRITELEESSREHATEKSRLERQVAKLEKRATPQATAERDLRIAQLEARVKELQERARSTEEELARRLTPQAEKELREQLRVKSEEAAELESIRAEKLRADQEVKRLTAALSAQGESSQAKIEGLRKQLEEAQGAARRAEKNASESEARFQAADRRAKELQDELVLVRKLNATLQSEADSAEELRAVLREIAGAVGASEEPSTLPQAVRGKVQELDAAQKLLAAVYKGLAGSDSLAVQLHETSPKEHPLDFTDLPRMVQDRIEEVEHLQSELARITQEKSEQEAKVLRLSANLDKATSQLKGLEVTEAALAKAQQELAALEKSAAATEERLNGEVRDLKREVRRQEELVKERQAVVEEVCAELTKAEEQRDRALEQRDAARKANVEKDQQIETLTREILSVEGELDRARRTLEDNTRHIRQMQAQIEEQSVGLSKRDQLIEDYRLRMEKAERSNKQLRAYIKETEQELEELKAEVEQLRRENRDLKKIIEQLAVILEVPFNPEEGTLGEQLLRRATALTKTERQLEEVMATHVKYEETIRRERERELLAVEEERLAREAEVERLALLAQQRERELESASSALTELQRQIQRAQDVGNALEEIGGEVGSEGVSLGLTRADADLVDVSRHHQDYLTIFPQLTKKEARLAAKSHKLGHDDALYLEALEKLREQYYGRHASFIRKQILEINAQPGKLNNLKLFTQFFGVTDQVSAITRTREFAQLKANRTMIERLQKQSGKEEQIARLTQENAVLTTALLRKTMQLIYRATDDSSGRSRFKNFGLHLMMWNDILNSLDASLYEEGDRRKALRSPDAELLRRTVGQLNVQFYRMMSMTHKQVQKGVWVAH